MKYAIIALSILVVAGFAAVGVLIGTNRDTAAGRINKSADNVAIRGFDTVAYFDESAPVEGKPELAFVWNGAKWLFSNRENLEKFKADPAAFAPQFGGHCSWAASQGYTADGDPTAWKVVEGKLYFNYNADVKKKWEANQDSLIKAGEANWKKR